MANKGHSNAETQATCRPARARVSSNHPANKHPGTPMTKGMCSRAMEDQRPASWLVVEDPSARGTRSPGSGAVSGTGPSLQLRGVDGVEASPLACLTEQPLVSGQCYPSGIDCHAARPHEGTTQLLVGEGSGAEGSMYLGVEGVHHEGGGVDEETGHGLGHHHQGQRHHPKGR